MRVSPPKRHRALPSQTFEVDHRGSTSRRRLPRGHQKRGAFAIVVQCVGAQRQRDEPAVGHLRHTPRVIAGDTFLYLWRNSIDLATQIRHGRDALHDLLHDQIGSLQMPEAVVAITAPTAVSPTPAPGPTLSDRSGQPAAPKPVTPGSKAWAEMTAEQRHAQLRGPENPRARGHSPAIEQREAAAARAAGEPPRDPAAVDPAAPAAASTEKLKVGKYEVSEGELASMMERQALEDQRRLTMPAAPEAYEAKLPADLKLPGGQTYTFDQSDPSLIAARNLAYAKGWSQQDFSEALGIFASHHAQREAILAERSRAEIEKAGVNAPQRVDAVGKWITGEMGEADAKPIRATIVTDAHLRFYEKLMNKISSQGAAGFSQSHRAPPDTNPIPGFDNMSFEQRRQAQDQNAARRNSR
jgi:hypothetical protein